MDPQPGHGITAAGRLYQLAVDYAERSHEAQAELIRAFEADAAALSPAVGEVAIEDDDDERLRLTAAGRFAGEVLVTPPSTSPVAGPGWQSLSSPDDVVDFYDPVDLFDDLADAIDEAFPGTAEAAPETGTRGAGPSPGPSTDAWLSRLARQGADPATEAAPSGADAGPAPAESASMTILRDLHAAGAYTDEDFAARKAELERREHPARGGRPPG